MNIEAMDTTEPILRYVATDYPCVWVRSADLGVGPSGREVAYYIDRRQNAYINWIGGGPLDGITVEVFGRQRSGSSGFGLRCLLIMPDWGRRQYVYQPDWFDTFEAAEATAHQWIESATNVMHTALAIEGLARESVADVLRQFNHRWGPPME